MLDFNIATPIRRCHGKISYDKRGAITAKNRRWKEDHVELRIYQHKDHWHLTSRGTVKRK